MTGQPLPEKGNSEGVGLYYQVMSEDYDYRIVLVQPDGSWLPLIPQGNLGGAQERLAALLSDSVHADGWIERRANTWERVDA